MKIEIRPEHVDDIEAISALTQAAFQHVAHSNQTEHLIVEALREREKLTISLVAVYENAVLGHVAISPVKLSSGHQDWYGLGPISVLPDVQGQGIGSALMQDVLKQLQALGAQGCVLLGDPNYYQKFAFKAHPNLVLADVPAEYFQALSFNAEFPKAAVFYDAAFYLSDT